MQFSETVILGGTCLAAGAVLNGNGNTTVLERGAVIGGEYFDTYRPISPMDQPVKSDAVRTLQEELRKRNALNDAYALLTRPRVPVASMGTSSVEMAVKPSSNASPNM